MLLRERGGWTMVAAALEIPAKKELMKQPVLEAAEVLLDALPDVVTEDKDSCEVQSYSAAYASECLPVDRVPRSARIDKQRPPDRPETESAEWESDGKLVDEGEAKFLADKPQLLAPETPAGIPPQIPAATHEESP